MYQKGAKGWLKHFDFMLLDLIVLQLSFLVAFQIRHGMVNPYASRDYLALAIITELADIVAMIFLNTYEGVLRRGYFKEFISSFKNGFVIVALLLLYVFVLKDTSIYSRITILLMWAIYVYATFAVRSLWKKHLEKYAEKGKGKKLLVMTTRHIADDVVAGLKEKNYSGFDIVGVMVVDANLIGQEIQGVPVVADYNSAVDYVRTAWVDEIYVDVRGAYGYANTLIDAFIEGGITVHMCISSIVRTHGDKQLIQKINGETVVTTMMNYATPKQMLLKRVMDIIGGLVGSIFTLILTIFIGPIIYIKSPGPIFFKQERVGLNGKIFKMYKFRSMYVDAEERKSELLSQNEIAGGVMFKIREDPRITRVGRFIRRTSIDELPQFWNILRGDMSLVGPRPEMLENITRYKRDLPEFQFRERMKAGLTGYAQIEGRYNTSPEDKLALDLFYIEGFSLWTDMKLLLRTVTVFFRPDATQGFPPEDSSFIPKHDKTQEEEQ